MVHGHVVESWVSNPGLPRTFLGMGAQDICPQAWRTWAGHLLLLLPLLCVSLRQPGWGKGCRKETRGNKEDWEHAGHARLSLLLRAAIKNGSKIKSEAPLGMEEINTEHYLTTNQIVWIKERLRLYRKFHCWHFLYFEDGTSYKCVRLLWHNYCWCGVSYRC